MDAKQKWLGKADRIGKILALIVVLIALGGIYQGYQEAHQQAENRVEVD